ncbi:MAG: YkvA family protein [Bacteroidota bacterium]
MKDLLKKYADKFSESSFWQKTKFYAQQAGIKTVYTALLLFYAYRRKETPAWAKHIIIGALGYFLALFDAIPDLTPIIGYTDDVGVLGFGLVTVAAYVNDEVRQNARERIKKWFGQVDESQLEAVDKQL